MKKFLSILLLLFCRTSSHAQYYITVSPNVITCEYAEGNTFQLKAFLHYYNTPNSYNITEQLVDWFTSDSTVASVDSNGLVTIHSDGKAEIRAAYDMDSVHHYENSCQLTSLPVGGTAAPLLREDLVWVGDCWFGPYHIKVDGDTIVDEVAYKKVYRRLNDIGAYPESSELPLVMSVTLSESTPVAFLREGNGRVYRLCDKDYGDFYGRDWDDPGYASAYDELYSLVLNSTDTHYEVVMYDFNQPNVVNQPNVNRRGYALHTDKKVLIDGDELRVYKEEDITPPGDDANKNDWWHYYNEHKRALLMVEGFGMLNGGWQGRDWLCPVRSELKSWDEHDYCKMGIFYVRDSKGVVLLYDDCYFWPDNRDEGGKTHYDSDPYDFSGDGEFDIDDLNAVINIMIGLRENDPEISADLSFDQTVDIEDLNLVINRLLSGVKPVKYSDLLKPSSE